MSIRSVPRLGCRPGYGPAFSKSLRRQRLLWHDGRGRSFVAWCDEVLDRIFGLARATDRACVSQRRLRGTTANELAVARPGRSSARDELGRPHSANLRAGWAQGRDGRRWLAGHVGGRQRRRQAGRCRGRSSRGGFRRRCLGQRTPTRWIALLGNLVRAPSANRRGGRPRAVRQSGRRDQPGPYGRDGRSIGGEHVLEKADGALRPTCSRASRTTPIPYGSPGAGWLLTMDNTRFRAVWWAQVRVSFST